MIITLGFLLAGFWIHDGVSQVVDRPNGQVR